MFSKASRYKSTPESAALDAGGRRQPGKELRVTPAARGALLHTVAEGDRLDLLAFRYYGDASKWWQICDANPRPEFPTELLEERTRAAETLALEHPASHAASVALRSALAALGRVERAEEGVLASGVVLSFDPQSPPHAGVVAALGAAGFRLLDSYVWTARGRGFESYTFDYPPARAAWRELVDALEALPGMLEVVSSLAEQSLSLVYNPAMLERRTMLALVAAKGFNRLPESAASPRVGASIEIPPGRVG
ncbi:MAG: tail protein X [Pyrinomonadaceae bacterium]